MGAGHSIISLMAQRDAGRKATVASGGTTIGRVIIANASVVSVGTTDVNLFTQSVDLTADAHVIVNLACNLSISAACTVTITVYLDGNRRSFLFRQVCADAGIWHLPPQWPVRSVTAGTHTIQIRIKVSTGTASIAVEDAVMHLYAEGLANGTGALPPEITINGGSVAGSLGASTAEVIIVAATPEAISESLSGSIGTETVSVTLVPV